MPQQLNHLWESCWIDLQCHNKCIIWQPDKHGWHAQPYAHRFPYLPFTGPTPQQHPWHTEVAAELLTEHLPLTCSQRSLGIICQWCRAIEYMYKDTRWWIFLVFFMLWHLHRESNVNICNICKFGGAWVDSVCVCGLQRTVVFYLFRQCRRAKP